MRRAGRTLNSLCMGAAAGGTLSRPAARRGSHATIEVGTGLSPRSPLRTGRADLPHPALQSAVCSVMEARDFSFSGIEQAKEPEILEVAVGPALMIDSTATAFQTAPLS